MITFLEAYETYGRDSMAIAEACGMTEAEAYNLMSSRVEVDYSPFDAAKAWRQEHNLRLREGLRAYRARARMGA